MIFFAMAAGFPLPGLAGDAEVLEIPESISEPAPVAMDENETALFTLINAARRDPLGVAESLGLKRKQILKNFPELADILNSGLPELTVDERLYATATEHTADMLANGYYAYDSLDGRTLEDRLQSVGYAAAASGESLGLIFFNNFINPETAVNLIFENMVIDELSAAPTQPRRIFNPDFSEIGVSFKGGDFQIAGFNANVYLAVCDFARPVDVCEQEMMHLINQFRAQPLVVAAEYGIDVDPADFPDLADALNQGLPPLAFDGSLYKAADALAADMFENGHFNALTADGRTLEDRVSEAGYDAIWVDEFRGRFPTCDASMSPEEILFRMFRYFLVQTFHEDSLKRNSVILDPAARECGLRIMAGESAELGGICGDQLNIMVAEFGAQQSDDAETGAGFGKLTGIVYQDANLNSLYDAGEGLKNESLVVAAEDMGTDVAFESIKILTNAAGGFAMDLPDGRYQLQVNTTDGKVMEEWVEIVEGKSALILFGFSEESF